MNIFQRIKNSISIGEYYRHKGLYFPADIEDHGGQFSCQIHGRDEHPSARYYPDTKLMKCHACGFSGDVIAVVQKLENVSNAGEAVNYLLNIFPQKHLEPFITPAGLREGNTGIGNVYIKRAKGEIFLAMGNKVWDKIDQTGNLNLIKEFDLAVKSLRDEDDLDIIFRVFDELI